MQRGTRNFQNQDKLFLVLQDMDDTWLDEFRVGASNKVMGQFVQHLLAKYHAKYPGKPCILPPYLNKGVERKDTGYYTNDEICMRPPPKLKAKDDEILFEDVIHEDFFVFWKHTVQVRFDEMRKKNPTFSLGKRKASGSDGLRPVELLQHYNRMSAEEQMEFQLMILPDSLKTAMLNENIVEG